MSLCGGTIPDQPQLTPHYRPFRPLMTDQAGVMSFNLQGYTYYPANHNIDERPMMMLTCGVAPLP